MKKSIEQEAVEFYTQQLALELESKANMVSHVNALSAFASESEMREYLVSRIDVPASILDAFLSVAIATDFDTFGETHPYQFYTTPDADDVWHCVLRKGA